jgi:hypothetical protein
MALFDPRRLLANIGRGRTAQFTRREIAELPDDVAACIQTLDVVTQNLESGDDKQETVVKVRWYDKRPMLELCARHFGWVKESASAEGLEALVQSRPLERAQSRERSERSSTCRRCRQQRKTDQVSRRGTSGGSCKPRKAAVPSSDEGCSGDRFRGTLGGTGRTRPVPLLAVISEL